MLLSYLKLSLRLLARNPFFTFINVLGLSVGFVAFFILWQFSSSELKADQYHKDYERIAKIGARWRDGSQSYNILDFIPTYQTELVFADFPEIKEHCRYLSQQFFNADVVGLTPDLVLAAENADGTPAMFKETNAISSDPNLFEFFTIPLIHGDKRTVLKNANAVVLSQKASMRYFGTKNPVNRLMKLNDSTTLMVTGVFEDLPRATHLNFDIVLSNVGQEHQWADASLPLSLTFTYVKLSLADEFKKMTNQLNLRKERYWNSLLKTHPNGSGELFLLPLHEVAFNNTDDQKLKSRSSLVMLQVISMVILIMAWVNYMNLTVSRIAKRSKEIATRKVSGAHAQDFMKQFLTEALLLNGISLAMAFTLVQLIRQPLHMIFDIEVLDFLTIPTDTWMAILAFIFSGVVVTALFPAFLSQQYNPKKLQVLQSKSSWIGYLSPMLTTFQYGIAFILITLVFIIYAQLTYLLDKDFLRKNEVMVVDAPIVKPVNYLTNINFFINEVRKQELATYSNFITGDLTARSLGMKRPQRSDFEYYDCPGGIDETFMTFFGIKILAGRNFRSNETNNALMVSRLAALRLGFDKIEDAIGSQIEAHMGKSENVILQIVGVYEDFPLWSKLSWNEGLDEARARAGSVLVFKNMIFDDLIPARVEVQVSRKNFKETLFYVEDTFRKIFPGSVFNWYFLDDYVNQVYQHEKIVRNQTILFTTIAIGIACLGLLGMITNKADEKVKEIGIRKVMGAGMWQISTVLLNSASRQVIVAVVLSLPIAFYLSQDYLQRYTDRIKMQWWHFISPIVILVLILLSTVVVVLYKAARSNPVEALKYE